MDLTNLSDRMGGDLLNIQRGDTFTRRVLEEEMAAQRDTDRRQKKEVDGVFLSETSLEKTSSFQVALSWCSERNLTLLPLGENSGTRFPDFCAKMNEITQNSKTCAGPTGSAEVAGTCNRSRVDQRGRSFSSP